jgi:NHLM bacteriocin system ABC transporter peptidase/ATP-binding protein
MPEESRRRVKTPTVLQMEAVECGAAALAMVLAYHGRFVPLEELRLACGVSRDGSKASSMLRAARQYGLSAKGFKKEPAQLKELPVPMVVHWNFNHFLVVEGFRKGRAYLNDPATGPRHVPGEEFDQAFTGVALVFERAPGFEPGGVKPSVLAALRSRVSGSGPALVYMALAGFALLIPGIITPTFSKIFVDNILVKGLTHWMTPLLLVMGGVALVTTALVWLQQRYLLRFETKLAIDSSAKFFWHVLRLPVEFFTQRYAGEIGDRVGLNDRIARLLSGDVATTALSVMVIAFYAALMAQYDAVLTLIAVATALLDIAALRHVSRKRIDLNQRLLQDRGKSMGTAMGGLQTIETLKATGSESDFFARWSGQQAKVVNAHQRLQLTTQLLATVPPLLLTLNTALILGVGGLRVIDGHLSMGMLVAFQSLVLLFLAPVNRMVTLGSTLQEVKGDMARLDDVLHAEPDPTAVVEEESAIADCATVKLSGALELRDVSFGYSRLEPPLIEGFNLALEPGDRVALVGASGCGKTTIARLVSGLHEPWSGEILFDGVPRSRIARGVMTNSLGVVDQEIFMFESTIRDNVTLWDATVSESDLARAGRDACIHEEVTVRSGGYASRVAEAGGNFSGGQRQRLEIARALVGNPTILVLDEATSALDPATEEQIGDNLQRRGCTCLIVAHRLSTIRDCDEIIVLDRGKIVQRGTHDEMCTVAGPYRDLIGAE